MPPPPLDEYCFLWINWWATCLTKGEWASWVQAIGTVSAVLATGLLAWWEVHQRRVQSRLDSASKFKARLAVLQLIPDQLQYFIEVGSSVGSAAAADVEPTLRLTLGEAMKMELREMPTPTAVVHLLRIQEAAGKLMKMLSDWTMDTIVVSGLGDFSDAKALMVDSLRVLERESEFATE